jgi:hypothetical protein
VTWEEFKAKYPNLSQTMEILATENNMEINKAIDIPPFLAPSLTIFENQASQLSDEEKETIALGEDNDRISLVDRTGFEAFDDFLTESFEGMLSEIFWSLPS